MRDRRRHQHATGHRYVSRNDRYHPNLKTRVSHRFTYCGCSKIWDIQHKLGIPLSNLSHKRKNRRNTMWKTYCF